VNGNFLLDTNIVIALFAGEPSVLHHLQNAAVVYIPSIVIGELFYGAYKSSHASENLHRIEEFADRNTILACDADTAFQYGKIKEQLRQIGRPIPENDIWIAATAVQYSHTLISRDEHFKTVQGLMLEGW
jgi:tRNA(fMet)-specific endonuclease VapC